MHLYFLYIYLFLKEINAVKKGQDHETLFNRNRMFYSLLFLVSENSMYDIISTQKTEQTILVFVKKILEYIIIEI